MVYVFFHYYPAMNLHLLVESCQAYIRDLVSLAYCVRYRAQGIGSIVTK